MELQVAEEFVAVFYVMLTDEDGIFAAVGGIMGTVL